MKIANILLVIFLFSLVGTALGELLVLTVPETWRFYSIISASTTPSWNIEKIDILILSAGFRVNFHFNIMTLAGLVAGCLVSLRRV